MDHMPTPYDGSSVPFTIGLKKIEADQWIYSDPKLPEHLAEKDAVLDGHYDEAVQFEAASLASQQEVLERLAQHLVSSQPERYKRSGSVMEVMGTQRQVSLAAGDSPPLVRAARLVQDDLALMRNDGSGHRLVAAVLCFPSGWSLREKFGKKLADVHGPVPGFGPASRNAAVIERIFSNLVPGQPVERLNWAFFDRPDLFYPHSGHAGASLINESGELAGWIRVERQTLCKMPGSGDVLFTIHNHVDPIDALARHPRRLDLTTSFRTQIDRLTPEEIRYKGLNEVVDVVLAELERLERT